MLNQRYKVISVQLNDLRLFRQGEMMLATAQETYRSNLFASHGFKHLYLVQNSTDWRILAEEWHRSNLPPPSTLQVAAKSRTDSKEELSGEWYSTDHRPAPSSQQVAEPPKENEEAKKSVELFVERWRLAWAKGDLSSYMACYHPQFRTQEMDLKGWQGYKKRLFQSSPGRTIQLAEITADLQGSTAVVVSKQTYSSETYRDFGLKTLHLRWHSGHWTIFKETWQPLPDLG